MAELKTKKTTQSVSAFLKAVPDPERRKDAEAVLKLMQKVTGQKPVLWGTSIVGFGQYHYKSERSAQEGDWPLVGFSPRSAALTIYLMLGFKKHAALLKSLGPHKVSGGSCLYIRHLRDIHIPTLTTLIAQSYKDMRKKHPTK